MSQKLLDVFWDEPNNQLLLSRYRYDNRWGGHVSAGDFVRVSYIKPLGNVTDVINSCLNSPATDLGVSPLEQMPASLRANFFASHPGVLLISEDSSQIAIMPMIPEGEGCVGMRKEQKIINSLISCEELCESILDRLRFVNDFIKNASE